MHHFGLGRKPENKKSPSNFLLGQDILRCHPAWYEIIPTHAYYHMLIFDYGGSYPGSDTSDLSISPCPQESIQFRLIHRTLSTGGSL